MDSGFKVTTRGRALQVALWAAKKPLDLTRVAVGDGEVEETVNLASVHELIHYVAEGTIGDRYAVDEELHFTVQYSSDATPGLGAFMLREFLVYAKDPETGQDVDFLYAALGDEANSVPAWSATRPPSLRQYPLVLHLDDALEVNCSAPAGLVTHDDLKEAASRMARICQADITLPADGWEKSGGEPYPWTLDVGEALAIATWIPEVTLDASCLDAAQACRLCPVAETLDGAVRFRAAAKPEEDMSASVIFRAPSGETAWVVGGVSLATDEEAQEMFDEVTGEGGNGQ